jgi:hypothetical protein
MPQPNLESELTEPQVEQLDALVLGGRHTFEQLAAFCQSQGWPSRSLGSWTGYKRRAQQRSVERSISDGTSLRQTIEKLAAGETDHQVQSILRLLGHITMQLAANGTASPDQLQLAQRLTALLVEAEGMKGRARLEEQKLGQRQQAINLDREKFIEATRKKVDAGLDEIAELFKRAPELLAEFTALRSKLSQRLGE